MQNIINKAETLTEALPYLRKYRDKIFVFKYGGHAMTDDKLRESFLNDVVVLKHIGIKPVIVHGGGPQIEDTLNRIGIESKYHKGLRITDEATMKVVEMVLVGQVGSELVRSLNRLGAEAVGLSGQDANLIVARKMTPKRDGKNPAVDLGEVGEIVGIDPTLVLKLCNENRFLPVISPVAASKDGRALNINADIAACEIAVALKAEKLVFLTDVAGVLDKNKKLVERMSVADTAKYIKNNTITGGMVPKIKSAADAVKCGVGSVAIVDGRIDHTVLLEIFTDQGMGTLITR